MKSKLLPLVLAASSIVATGAENPSIVNQLENNYQSARVRTEYNRINETDTLRTTIGAAASPKNYTDYHGSVAALFESFRLNNDHNFDSKQNYTSLGTVVPLKFDNLSSQSLVFGTFGDKRGLGLEQNITIGNVTPSISYEQNIDNQQERFGTEIEYKSGKIKTALGFDTISQPGKEDITQVLARARYDLNKADSLGLALVHKDYGNKTENSVLGLWAHASKDSSFSTRAIYQFTTDSQGKDTHFGQLIFIPSAGAFTGIGGAEYFMDRRSSRGEEPFSMNVTPLSVSSVQAVPVMDRLKSGLSFLISDKHVNSPVENSDTLVAGIGYTHQLENGKYLSSLVEYSFSDAGKTRQESISPRVRLDLGNFEIGAKYSFPINSKTKPAMLLEAQLNF